MRLPRTHSIAQIEGITVFRRGLSTRADEFNSLISEVKSKKHLSEKDSVKPLSGTSFVAKDNIAFPQGYTTCASKALSNYRSPFKATVIQSLEDAGSDLIGKANLDEFGMGSSNVESYFGAVINPAFANEKRIAGGSSGGSAAAVRSEASTFALGTDTGGSVRLPAAYTGVIGFKPTYGRVSRWGVIPYAQTLDTVGILARDIGVVKQVFNAIDQHDEKDVTSIPEEIRSDWSGLPKLADMKNTTVGVPEEFLVEELSGYSRQVWYDTLNSLRKLGCTIKQVNIPQIEKSLSAYYTIVSAEAASNLSRYDGVRYGFNSTDKPGTVHDIISRNRSSSFGQEVQRRIILGNYTLSSESGDHYLKATEVRKMLVKELNQVFSTQHMLFSDDKPSSSGCDVLISPTYTSIPCTLDEYHNMNEENFLNNYINDILTVPASLAGVPAISVPYQKQNTPEAKIPEAIQIIAQHGNDEFLLDFTKELMMRF
ncbi:Piso0_000090 [Millerozyma farinosa CBS 7064]|uniref:Glutamyl-tRNA(Gln) amidotransferase subunit A, mitochondrial n=1 Tax=Pichia sorbitophila (strain ATCC MYA-4447 / BCRC 22081 / CBS 7064 / NBRC 10061 / NRRL Y-12695) TaxID=559304 RepID=G8YT25_PICSO|nr:Piso0_000090 [Millerozyma farinosa CBS 7064]